MQALTANDAKTHFGDLLLKIQREPVQINRNGKPVAVVLSVEDYQQIDALKMHYLKTRIIAAKKEIALGRTVDGQAFFEKLLNGQFD